MSNTLDWAVDNIRLPKGTKWDFKDRAWQLSILNDDAQKVICRKPTQVGMSTVFLIKMLHFADQNTCRLLYTLPRQDDVYDMVNTRLNDIIVESPYIQEAISGTDNIRMKKYRKSWLHFVEMSVTPRMLDADWMLNDEVDLSVQENLQQAISRLDASKIGVHHQISTPSIEGYGIDALYQNSDKKEWFIRCGYCNYEQNMTWDANLEISKNGAFYKCSKCGQKIHPEDIAEGRWISTSDTKSDISGYQISQLMIPSLTAERLYKEYKSIDRKIFYNYRLGLPYSPQSASFDRETILNNCISGDLTRRPNFDNGSYVLGCDQGNTLHVCIAKVHGDRFDIVFLGTFEDFDAVERLAKLYNIRFGVLDALPNHHSAMKVNQSNRKIRLAFFGTADKVYVQKDERIHISKTDAYDMLLQQIVDGKMRIYSNHGNLPPEVSTAIAHLCNMRRDIQTQNSRFGGIARFHIWKNVGPDHYADAMLYAMVAADAIGSRGKLDATSINSDMIQRSSLFSAYFGKRNEDILAPVYEMEGAVPHDMMQVINHGLAQDNPYVNKRLRSNKHDK